MSELLQRVARIVRSYVSPSLDFPADPRDQVGQVDHESQTEHATRREKTRQRSRVTSPAQPSHNPYPGIPQHVIDDLSVFGLTPPSSLDEVRTVRNKEIQKYHSDRFVNDPDRFETSTEIMQIYNAAFARLRAYYEKP